MMPLVDRSKLHPEALKILDSFTMGGSDMTEIDWTQPVETTETPPRPVRVLFNKDGKPDACKIGPDFATLFQEVDCVIAQGDNWRITLRNVPPPKPEPVRRNAFLHLRADGGVAVTYIRPKGVSAVEVREIAWMSDGSPVPGEETISYSSYERMCDERDALKAELATFYCPCGGSLLTGHHTDDCPVNQAEATAWWQIELDRVRTCRDDIRAERDALKAEVAHRERWLADARAEVLRMKPVYDAAVAWSTARDHITINADRSL